MDILIKNVQIVGSEEKKSIKEGFIGIRNEHIVFVDETGERAAGFKANREIDGKNMLAMPGMINSHTHSAMTLFRNFANDLSLEDWLFNKIFPAEQKMTCDDVYWGTMLGIAEMIKSGTTCFADMYLHMEAVVQAVTETGIRANLSRSPLRFETGATAKIYDESKDCIKYHADWHDSAEGRIKVYLEVHSTYLFNEEQLIAAATLAKQLGTGIQIGRAHV